MKDGIYITQSKYIKEILKKIGMEDYKFVGTLMSTRHKLSKDVLVNNLSSLDWVYTPIL